MRITNVSEAFNSEFRKTEGNRRTDRSQKTAGAPRPDRSELSANARQLSETRGRIEIVAAQMEHHADVRPEKVAEAQEKIRSGFYNTAEFVDKLAVKLIKDFGLGTTQEG
mgnify:CR=1 FL=1